MFQPDQASLLAWTSSSVIGNLQRYPEIKQPHLDAVRPSAGEHTRIRGLALPIGLAILFLVLALVLLTTSSTASAYAALAAPAS